MASKNEVRLIHDDEMDTFSELMDSLYEFVQISRQYQSIPRSYGTDEMLYMAEVHLLQQIARYNGITMAELAQSSGKSASSISQLVSKLIAKKMLYREEIPNNKKSFILRLTEKGKQVNAYHEQYDVSCYAATLQKVRGYTVDDFKRFLTLLNAIKEDIKEI